MLDISSPADWAVSLLYAIDPPYNLFPSLHLSIAALAAVAAWKAAKPYGAIAFVGVVAIGVSVCTVKQHFLLDALGGLGLAAVVATLMLQGYRAESGVAPAYSWRGPASYLGFLFLIYGGLYLACWSGTRAHRDVLDYRHHAWWLRESAPAYQVLEPVLNLNGDGYRFVAGRANRPHPRK